MTVVILHGRIRCTLHYTFSYAVKDAKLQKSNITIYWRHVKFRHIIRGLSPYLTFSANHSILLILAIIKSMSLFINDDKFNTITQICDYK